MLYSTYMNVIIIIILIYIVRKTNCLNAFYKKQNEYKKYSIVEQNLKVTQKVWKNHKVHWG